MRESKKRGFFVFWLLSRLWKVWGRNNYITLDAMNPAVWSDLQIEQDGFAHFMKIWVPSPEVKKHGDISNLLPLPFHQFHINNPKKICQQSEGFVSNLSTFVYHLCGLPSEQFLTKMMMKKWFQQRETHIKKYSSINSFNIEFKRLIEELFLKY